MRKPDLVTVGEAFEDLIFLGLRRLPKPGEEVKTSHFARTVGGGALDPLESHVRQRPAASDPL
ncbi:MAG TPA: hypothetical protein PLH72_03715 [Vicinamibacterales bacterium]|nr:hypothetical protein [Vicinamibacterales bacterium]